VRNASRDLAQNHGAISPLRAARPRSLRHQRRHTINDAIANSIANTALLIGAKLIVNFTETGKSTYRMSKARPCCPIISVTNSRTTCHAIRLDVGRLFGLLKTSMPDFIEEMEVLALKIARDLKIPGRSSRSSSPAALRPARARPTSCAL
jgi:pyruvate kinase